MSEETIVEEYTRQVTRDPRTGRIVKEVHLLNGQIHREGGPAHLLFDPTGNLIRERWFLRGVQVRNDGPSGTDWDSSGNVTFQVWTTEYGLHREGGLPAKMSHDPDTGIVVREEFYLFGKEHHDRGPSLIERDPQSGIVVFEEWKQHGQLTRIGGNPALFERDPETGAIARAEHWLDGRQQDEMTSRPLGIMPGPK